MSRRTKSLAKAHKPAASQQASLRVATTKAPAEIVRPAPGRSFHLAVVAVLLGLCAVLYGRTLDFPMQFDDVTYLQQNPMLRDSGVVPFPADLKAFFQQPRLHAVDSDVAMNMVTRPLVYSTFHLNWTLSGYEPRWWRVVNIAIHAACSILVYALALVLLRAHARAGFIAFTAAAFFCVHPLAIESVTYIVQRLTSLMALFFLLAVWLHLHALQEQGRRRVLLHVLSVLAMMAASLSKECAVVGPLMAMMLDQLSSKISWRQALRRALPLLPCALIPPALVFAAAWGHHGGTSLFDLVQLVNNKEQPVSHWHYLLTEFTVIVEYLRQMLWPSGLNLDPQWPMQHSLLALPVLGSLLLLAGVTMAAWLLHRQQWLGLGSSIVWAGVLWFLGTIAITSGAAPLPDVMAEHRTYLPSVGAFIVVAFLLEAARERMSRMQAASWLVPATTVLAIVALSVVNWQRNEVWRSDLAMWSDAAAKSPDKCRPWANLAVAHASRQAFDEALRCCDRALAIEPIFGNPSILKATIHNQLKHYQEAHDEMQRLVGLDRRALLHPEVRYNLGVALFGLGRLKESEEVLDANVQRMPTHWASRVVLGLICRKRKEWDEALNHLRIAAQICPDKASVERLISQTEARAARTITP